MHPCRRYAKPVEIDPQTKAAIQTELAVVVKVEVDQIRASELKLEPQLKFKVKVKVEAGFAVSVPSLEHRRFRPPYLYHAAQPLFSILISQIHFARKVGIEPYF
jgi:hypothetical protein